MPTAEKTATTTKETWYDWFPEERIEDGITRDELLEEVAARGMASHITHETLAYWQKNGTIPYPIRRWRDHATRALYPRRAIAVLGELLTLQYSGLSLQEIGARLRGAAALTSYPDPDDLYDSVTSIADRHGLNTGRRIFSIEIRLTDFDGREDAYSYVVHTNRSGPHHS